MPKKNRSASDASRLLADYEAMNRDIPAATRRHMGMFAIAPSVPKDSLEELFGRPLGNAPYTHRCWLWWQAMRFSGLSHHWDDFAALRNEEGIGPATKALRSWVSLEEWKSLSRRMGYDYLNPHRWNWEGIPSDIWTKGGSWHRDNTFTRILLLGEHIERDPPRWNALTDALGPTGIRQLEAEASAMCDPDRDLYPVAVKSAVDYIRGRIPQLAGWNIENAGWRTVSWFFQRPVPVEDDRFSDFKMDADIHVRRRKHQTSWLPTIRDQS